jgi:hypothetical protein
VIRETIAVVWDEIRRGRERLRGRLYALYVGEVEARLRVRVENEIKERVRIAEEHRMVEKLCTFMKNAPGQTRDGYIKLLRNGRWREQPAWDWAPKDKAS